MKAEAEKLKVRTGLSMVDIDWSNAQKAAKIEKIPISQFMREAVNAASSATITARQRTTAKKELVG